MNRLLFTDVILPERNLEERWDVTVEGGRIASILSQGSGDLSSAEVIEGKGRWLLPGFIDDHVHLREPGLEEKEGYWTGTRAAAAGGVTTLLEIQNNPPLMTSRDALIAKRDLVLPKSVIHVGMYASLVPEAKGQLAEMSDLVDGYKLFMGPSTGNLDVGGDEILGPLFAEVATTGHWLFVHAEDGDLIAEGMARYGQDGSAAWHLARSDHAEIKATTDAIRIANKEGTRLHVFHLSSAGAVDAIAEARKGGQEVTSGTCPHYLYFTHEDTATMGSVLKVNPSIKGKDDRERLIEGLRDGTIDCLSSDHAPHTDEEKDKDFTASPSGIPCLDIFMPLCLTLVDRGILTLTQVLERAARSPAKVHGFETKGRVEEGFDADLVLVDPQERRVVRGEEHISKAHRTPYEGMELWGWPTLTLVAGEVAHRRDPVSR